MKLLELRIPPPIVTLAFGAAMWALCGIPQTIHVAWITVAAGLAAAGLAVAGNGVLAFRRARTTVNPLKPADASALVTGGVYRFTRNPMYLGMLLALCAWATFLTSPWAWLGPAGFALYITRFQIVPEERVLEGMFGAEFTAYKARVRRWL